MPWTKRKGGDEGANRIATSMRYHPKTACMLLEKPRVFVAYEEHGWYASKINEPGRTGPASIICCTLAWRQPEGAQAHRRPRPLDQWADGGPQSRAGAAERPAYTRARSLSRGTARRGAGNRLD
eukprot:scaffold42656_cov34-Tisochrysis_lutea.AAC.3